MKNKALQEGIFQGFIFNLIIFVWLLFIGLNYIYPEYSIIEGKKNELTQIQDKYDNLKSKWLSYGDFTSLHTSLWRKELSTNIHLTSVLKEFTKEDYANNFINTKWWKYENFINIKKEEIKKDKNKLEESGVSDNIKNILPYYTEDSSLSNDSLTDFRFINHIETLLNNFRLEYSDSIGIWNLSLEESVEWDIPKNKWKENQLEWKIYNFDLELWLVWRKKNVIDFIHYIENVWNIKIWDNWEIEVKSIPLGSTYINDDWEKVKNNFNNIWRYFVWKKDIYNNLIVDIKSIKFENYLDSSNLPTKYNKNETFINFIKKDKNQVDEKYEVNLVLKFYVKGLPTYKIKNYISNITFRQKKLLWIISWWIRNWEANKSKLKYIQRSSLLKLKEYNFYINSISKEIKELNNSKKLKTEIWNVYKSAQNYNEIFNKIEKGLDTHLKNVSKENYKQFQKYKLDQIEIIK